MFCCVCNMCSHYCVREKCKWYTKGHCPCVCGLSRFEHLYSVRLFLAMAFFLILHKAEVSAFAP